MKSVWIEQELSKESDEAEGRPWQVELRGGASNRRIFMINPSDIRRRQSHAFRFDVNLLIFLFLSLNLLHY